MIKHRFVLKEYSLLAASLLIYREEIHAQVIYTDIVPDRILDTINEELSLDMDFDGILEFQFTKEEYSNDTDWGGSDHFSVLQANALGDTQNRFAASYDTIGWAMYSSYIIALPYAFDKGYPINVLLNFMHGDNQSMAAHIYNYGGWEYTRGNWVEISDDKFLGVHFIDSDENYHYGWIRCAIEDSGKTLIVKDYAYELHADATILAGDTVSYTLVDKNISKNKVNIYSFRKNIYIHLPELPASVCIYNMSGDIILNRNVSTHDEIISCDNYLTGNYLVRVLIKGKSVPKLIYIE